MNAGFLGIHYESDCLTQITKAEKNIDRRQLGKRLCKKTAMDAQMKRIGLLAALALAFAGLNSQAVKQPARAAIYSALLPGGGQIYNGAYLKAGLVAGVQGYLLWTAIYNDGKRDEYRDKAQNAPNEILQLNYANKSREYKAKVTNDIWWMGITAGLSVLDAYVDAHLYNFEADKAKVHLLFDGDGAKLQYRF